MKKEDNAPHSSQSASADDAGHVKEEDFGSTAAAPQQDVKQESPKQNEQRGHNSKRTAEAAPEGTSAKKAKNGKQGSSPTQLRKGVRWTASLSRTPYRLIQLQLALNGRVPDLAHTRSVLTMGVF